MVTRQYDDFGLIYLLILGIKGIGNFIDFFVPFHLAWQDLYLFIYFAPLFFYWKAFPLIRTIGRWVNRGQ